MDSSASMLEILANGNPDYNKLLIERFTEEAFRFHKKIENFIDNNQIEKLQKITQKFIGSALELGGYQLADLCAKLVEKSHNESYVLTRSDISDVISAKDQMIADLMRIKRDSYSGRFCC